ncbi:putative ribonuclease H-like domain-containing protein [Tanacetum coccineum]
MFTLLRSFATVEDFPLLHEDKIYSDSNTRVLRIQQYLQHEHYALWEVIEVSDSYKAPPEESGKGVTGEGSAKKKGRTVAITTEDMQKRRNDVKARATFLLALPDEHQMRFSKYNNAKELWEAILKTFGGNEATKKTKNNQLKQQYGISTYGVQVSTASTDVAAASLSHDNVCAYIATQPNGSQIKYEDITQIDDDDIEEMEIKWNLALLSMRADRFWKKTGKKITIQGSDVARFDKSKVECFNFHKMGHFARECRAPRSQDKGRRESYKKDPKVEEPIPKEMIAIDGIRWDWSYMADEDENHALVANEEEVPTEYALMAKSSSSSDNEVYDDSYYSKLCRKNTENLNNKIIKLNEELNDCETDLYNYKRGLSQGEARLVEFKNNKIKFCERIRVLERDVELKDNKIENLRNELEEDSKSVKDKTGLGLNEYTVVPPPPAQVYSPPKNDLSWTGFPEFVDDTVTEYSRPTPSIDVPKDVSEGVSFFEQRGSIGGKITGKGTIKTGKLEFENVYFVKELKYNLFSVSQICDNKNSVLFTDSECLVLGKDFKVDDSHVLLRTPRQHNMYSIDLNNIVPHKNLTCLVAKAFVDESMLWHRRLGYLNFKTMNKLVRNNLVKGLPSKSFENNHPCVACLKGKQHKASCKTKIVNSVSKPLHTLHMDLFGPTSVSSLNHKWYCLVVTDDFSRFTWTFFLNAKSETSRILRNFITEIENLKDLKVKIIRCDNGGEFRNREMDEFCSRKGFLRPFGCHVMILNTLDHLSKFDAKRDEGYFVGYSLNSKAFRVFNKRTKKIEENMHVDFLENQPIKKGAGPNWLFDIDSLTKSMNYVLVVVAGTSSTNISGTKEVDDQAMEENVSTLRFIALPNCSGNSNPTATSNDPTAKQEEPVLTPTVETEVPTVSSSVPIDCLSIPSVSSSGPRIISRGGSSYQETPSLGNAMSFENRLEDLFGDSTDSVSLNEVEADLSNMETNIQDVWVLVDCPKGVRPIITKWVLKNKRDSRGIVIRNKARLVAQGYTQEEEIDYEEVFAPVVRIEAIRLFLAYASYMGFTVYQMDVKSAFLYGTIDEEVYVMQPPGFQDSEYPDRVYKVVKAMYGLHQALRAWYGTLSKYLLDNGFQRGTIDQTLFIRKYKGEFLLVQVYVDDIIFGSSNPKLCREFEALMHDKFKMSAMGELTFFLGLQVLQKTDGIFLSQDKYVADILKKFGLSDVRSAKTPMDREHPWGKDGTGKDVELHLYRSMIGSLMYLTASRPDIMFAVCACARHQVTPKECHLHAVKRIFRYLKGHPKLGLWYPKESPFDLVAFSDSDYGGANQDRKSTTRGCQFLGRRLISWQCKKQTIMATSTTEAEYVVATSGYEQVLWIQN